LIAAQVAVASHVDVDGHAVESPCAICVSASTLSAGAIAAIALVVPAGRSPSPALQAFFSYDREPVYAQPARAPPVSA
jgi:hypothetical protein